MSARRFASSLALGGSFACQVHDFDYSDKACPCPEPEWVCRTETKRCVRSAAASTVASTAASSTDASTAASTDASTAASGGSCETQSTGTSLSELGHDSFDRPDERPLSGCGRWVGGYKWPKPVELAPFELVSGSARGTSTEVDNVMAFSVPTPANQYIEVRLRMRGVPGMNSAPGAFVRLQPAPTVSGYECRIASEGSRIGKWVDGEFDRLIVKAAVIWQVDDILRCEAVGTQIRMFRIRDGEKTPVLTATDSAHPKGSTGVISFSPADVEDAVFDDVVAGELPPP